MAASVERSPVSSNPDVIAEFLETLTPEEKALRPLLQAVVSPLWGAFDRMTGVVQYLHAGTSRSRDY